MGKKIILFGAGIYGKRALDCYGAENVYAFADNDPKKVGSDYLGKPIISFETLKGIHEQYRVVVSTARWHVIKEQLEAEGIPVDGAFSIRSQIDKETLLSGTDFQSYGTVALYGIGHNAEVVWELLQDREVQVRCVIEKEDDALGLEQWRGLEVRRIENIHFESACVIITDDKYNRRDELYLRRVLKDTKIKIVNPFRRKIIMPKKDLVFLRYPPDADVQTAPAVSRDMRDAVSAYVREAMQEVPLFDQIEIETYNRCNGSCSFCPVSRRADTREPHLMDEALFNDIIDQLAALDYDGRISPFSNNEPLLDDRLVRFCKRIKEKLPRAFLGLFTNGTMFTLDKFEALIACVDELVIDNYHQELRMIRPVQEVYDYCQSHPELLQKVTISMRKPNQVLTSRGGNAPNRPKETLYADDACALPFQQFIVRPTGQVSLCCNDALGEHTLGDLTKESLVEIWYGEKYRQVRQALAKGRSNYGNCKFCDTFILN